LAQSDDAGTVLVSEKALRLRAERGRDRTLAGAAEEHDLLALGIGDRLGIEGRERHDHAIRIGLGFDLVRLADVDEEIAPFRDTLGDLVRGQILYLVCQIILQHPSVRRGHPGRGNLASRLTKIKRYKGLSRGLQVKAKSQRLEARPS